MSVNSLCPSWERHPDVFSNRCIARDLDVSISGSHFSFLAEYLVTLGIHSWKEKYGGFGGGFHLLWLCWLSGYLTASYPASFSPDRKDLCKSLRPVPRGWEKNIWHLQEESQFEILSFAQSSNARTFFWRLKFSLRSLCVYFLVFFFFNYKVKHLEFYCMEPIQFPQQN